MTSLFYTFVDNNMYYYFRTSAFVLPNEAQSRLDNLLGNASGNVTISTVYKNSPIMSVNFSSKP